MAASFFSEFGLLWYLGELRKDEFRKFKLLLKEEPLHLGLQPIPWAEVKKASREDLAGLLVQRYEEKQAWDVTFILFQKIGRKDLCEKAKMEITGHMKTYRAHVKERFSRMWFRDPVTRMYEYFEKDLTPKERGYLEFFFAPQGEAGNRMVVLRGISGIGKTTLLVKLMLAWAEGMLYQDRFSYVFYFSCREATRLPPASLAALACRGWSDTLTPVAEMASQPERLLFILDGLEELTDDLDGPESDLCCDWMEQRPVRAVLSSLLRRRLVPESCLLLATVPVYPRGVEDRLGGPEVRTMAGFSDAERKLYFCCIFRERSHVVEAFSLVRDNEQLFTMCRIPVLCWVVCTCLKQELERGRDLAPTCRRTTSLYASFLLNLFTPKAGAWAPDEQGQGRGRLKGLCSLAAEGMWSDTFIFSMEDLQRNGLVGADVPALLDGKALRECGDTEGSYAFVHACVQEFCAATFYLVSSHTDHPHPAVGSAEALLSTYLQRTKVQWIYLGCFLCGLLHGQEQEKLQAFFGAPLHGEDVERALRRHLENVNESTPGQREVDFLALCYCLFEMENAGFLHWAMDLFLDVRFSIMDRSDLVVSAYCLKHCSSLRKLRLSIQNVFAEGEADTSMSSYYLVCWYQVCSALTTNENLRELQVEDSNLNGPAFRTLSRQLKHPRCRLQKLQIKNVSFSGESWLFFEALMHSPDLQHLDLSGTSLSRDDVASLCNALKNPVCGIEKLLLANCGLLADDCEAFKGVLVRSSKLRLLNVSYNYLDHGLSLLCEALCHPACTLEALVLGCCYLRERCWRNLYEVLLCSKSLIHLDVNTNVLKYEDLSLLCQALRQPSCQLMSLCVLNCFITAKGCRDLACVLAGNLKLRSLQIGHNDIGDDGVRLLCQALLHPRCCLENLGLGACKLTGACCEDLASVLVRSPTLRTLNLSRNTLDHDGVVALCEALRHPECRLRILGLKIAEFDEETQRLLMAEEERNPFLTITDD
ncbi:NACHT, LRR and PYD domains-containing protein 4 [Saccopteryx leptura]|uniref:NACHT, LRR and PYD domains-containing protein 4 n=1 Tax=Saccopteryx leptura TaxID=249018 RepID=UPI00339C5054